MIDWILAERIAAYVAGTGDASGQTSVTTIVSFVSRAALRRAPNGSRRCSRIDPKVEISTKPICRGML